MSIEKVRKYFAGFGMEDRILEFSVSSATVELAAQAVGVDGCRIAKTLSFDVNGDTVLIMIVICRNAVAFRKSRFYRLLAKLFLINTILHYTH